MRKSFFLAVVAILCSTLSFAEKEKDSLLQAELKMIGFMDSVNSALKYETGLVNLPNGIATLKIPARFKYLNPEQSKFVVNKVWGNPERPDILGMLFPAEANPYSDSSYAFVISFDNIGYVKDEDADKIDYNDLLKDIQKDEIEVNKERQAGGYESIHMVGWAQQPFYDKNQKVLHWAKELRFGNGENGTVLNYDIRVLGRKGVLSFNAVAGINELPLVKKDIDKVLAMSNFSAGNKYSDFDSNIDEVAAYSLGGLVAGKILMKVGLWAMIAKFWKLIIGGIVAAYYGLKKFLTGKGRKEEEYELTETTVEEPEATETVS